jgi:hypothetical protein
MPKRPLPALLVALLVASLAAVGRGETDPGQTRPPAPEGELLRIDPAAFEIAAATGGFYFFWQPGEFSALAPVASRHLFATGETIEQVDGWLQGSVDLPFEVEASDAAITVRVGLQSRGEIEIFAPGTRVPYAGPEGMRTAHMLVEHVPEPIPGTWSVRLTGAGVYLVNVTLQPRSQVDEGGVEGTVEPGDAATPGADLERFRRESPEERWDTFRRLPEARRRGLAQVLLDDVDPAVAYVAASSLAREGHLDEAVPVFARILVSGQNESALHGRMGYDWIHDDDETLAERVIDALARHLRAHLHEYTPAERARAELLLATQPDDTRP